MKIINLTIVECKFKYNDEIAGYQTDNKSNHSGM